MDEQLSRVRLENMSQSRFRELEQSSHPWDKLHRCQILHYSRRNPITGSIAPEPTWIKSSCPWSPHLARNEWEEIKRPTFTNQQLLEEVEKIPQLINNDEKKEKELYID